MAKAKKINDAVAAAVILLCEAFRREATEATIEAYRIGLRGLPEPAIKTAVAAALGCSKFMPSPAELRELSGEVRIEDRAVLAFSAFDRAVERHGYYSSIDFDDRAINATVRALGGWERVCDTPLSEWNTFFRKRFIETYSAYARSGATGECGAALVGFFDRENHFNGHESNHLVRIETGLPPLIGVTGAPQPLHVGGQPRGELPKLLGDVLEEKCKQGNE